MCNYRTKNTLYYNLIPVLATDYMIIINLLSFTINRTWVHGRFQYIPHGSHPFLCLGFRFAGQKNTRLLFHFSGIKYPETVSFGPATVSIQWFSSLIVDIFNSHYVRRAQTFLHWPGFNSVNDRIVRHRQTGRDTPRTVSHVYDHTVIVFVNFAPLIFPRLYGTRKIEIWSS